MSVTTFPELVQAIPLGIEIDPKKSIGLASVIPVIEADLLAEVARCAEWLEANPDPYFIPEGTEEWQRGEERNRRLAEHAQKTESLAASKETLARIEAGTFGICLECRGEIDVERLRMHPTFPRCTKCQGEIDKKSRNLRNSRR